MMMRRRDGVVLVVVVFIGVGRGVVVDVGDVLCGSKAFRYSLWLDEKQEEEKAWIRTARRQVARFIQGAASPSTFPSLPF